MRSCSCRKSSRHWPEIAALFAAALLAGCAGLEPYRFEPASARLTAPAGEVQSGCTRLFERVDHGIEQAGVRDARATIVNGFPYLRADRLVASLASDAVDGQGFEIWVGWMQRLDEEARSIELANLDAGRRQALGIPEDAGVRLGYCRTLLAQADLADRAARDRLRAASVVPPDYDLWKRALGLYPLTRIPFAAFVRDWQRRTAATFAAELQALPVRGRLVRYVPQREGRMAREELASILARASDHPLGVPELSPEESERLFAAFAPAFEVEVVTEDDRIGALAYGTDETLGVDAARPVVYERVSYARYGAKVLLQLNYSMWFASRPAESALDLLAGRFDGLTWRVTLAPDGSPLAFDTIHNCGCYHLFFPTPRAVPRAQPDSIDEWMFSPQSLPGLSPADRITLRLEASTHYLQRVLVNAAPDAGALRYALADDEELRSLPFPGGGRRSAFGPDGIVRGSERGERYLFWPMGVRNPGAMRQWGRHATAFVGLRHFDDPDLFERYFELLPP